MQPSTSSFRARTKEISLPSTKESSSETTGLGIVYVASVTEVGVASIGMMPYILATESLTAWTVSTGMSASAIVVTSMPLPAESALSRSSSER